MILPHSRFVIVSVGGHAVLHFEEIIGVAVHVGFRRGGEPHHQRVKVLKNRPVFFENAPVAFINDDQIEMRRGEQPAAVFGLGVVDGVEDGRVGGEHDAGVPVVFVGAEIAQGQIRQIILKTVFCLFNQRGAVG